MTALQEKLVQMALEVNARATIDGPDDMDRPFSEIGLDSLDTMSLMLAVTEQFAIRIPDSEIDAIQTLNELADVIQRKMAEPEQGS